MRVGILGSGEVGRVLGKGFADSGHEVKLGTRNPEDARVTSWLAEAGAKASAGSFAEAATFGEIAVLATRWAGTENAIHLAGPANLAGKLVLDPTNPLDFAALPPTLNLGHTDSGGEQVQRWLPKAHVVKAFNHVGSSHMVKPTFPGGPPDMFICGNDPGAKEKATRILREFGWSVIDLGGIESSRYLEPLAMVWILHYFQIRSGNHAFKLLRK
jgi:predicted dinucleotide-binding enzyme